MLIHWWGFDTRSVSLKKLILAFTLFTAFSFSHAFANNAKDDTCRFADTLHLGTGAIEAVVLELAKQWPENDRAKLVPVVIGPLAQYKLERAHVYDIANFDPHFREYLVVTGDKSSGIPIFFRITYTQLGNNYFFKNINLNSSFNKIMASGFAYEPKAINC